MTDKPKSRAYTKGRAAYLAGDDFNKNPWPLFTDSSRGNKKHPLGHEWHTGWLDAWTEAHPAKNTPRR